MLTKNKIKQIVQLQQKKYRKQYQLFFAESQKVITEFLDSDYELQELFAVKNFFPKIENNKITIINEEELKKISALVTPNECLAVFRTKEDQKSNKENQLILALDSIRDPGNLGTIIRLADWFGVATIVCNPITVDVYNPKVIQATMGSLARVSVEYLDLENFLQQTSLPVFGTFMEGENIYKTNLPKEAILLLGNEANGISENIENLISQKITIPRFGKMQKTESLNVATATAIVLSEFCRKN